METSVRGSERRKRARRKRKRAPRETSVRGNERLGKAEGHERWGSRTGAGKPNGKRALGETSAGEAERERLGEAERDTSVRETSALGKPGNERGKRAFRGKTCRTLVHKVKFSLGICCSARLFRLWVGWLRLLPAYCFVAHCCVACLCEPRQKVYGSACALRVSLFRLAHLAELWWPSGITVGIAARITETRGSDRNWDRRSDYKRGVRIATGIAARITNEGFGLTSDRGSDRATRNTKLGKSSCNSANPLCHPLLGEGW